LVTVLPINQFLSLLLVVQLYKAVSERRDKTEALALSPEFFPGTDANPVSFLWVAGVGHVWKSTHQCEKHGK